MVRASPQFASLKDGIKAKHDKRSIPDAFQFASLKDGIKAKQRPLGMSLARKFASLKDGIKAKPHPRLADRPLVCQP